jgi:hypothetical protein
MSWVEIWIDQGQAPSLDAILQAIDQSGAKAVNFYLGGRFAYLGGGRAAGWTPELMAAIAAARPGMGFFGSWVSLRPGEGGYGLGHQDGLDAASAAQSYSLIRWLSYDVEAGAFDANPTGAAQAMLGFTDAVHQQGYKSMPYSVPRGLTAGAGSADAIWIANPNPGGDDPAVQPLNAAFFAGKRSVQCCLLIVAGVDWDLSHSQFSIGGDDLTPEEHQTLQDVAGAVAALQSGLLSNLMPPGGDPAGGFLNQRLVPMEQQLTKLAGGRVDVNALAAALGAALAAHPITAQLTQAERDAVRSDVVAKIRAQFDKP